MTHAALNLLSAAALGASDGAVGVIQTAPMVEGPGYLALIPLLPLIASVLCLALLFLRNKSKLPAIATVVALAISFVITLVGFLAWSGADSQAPQVVKAWEWIHASWGTTPGTSLLADIGFYLDGLSWLWMLFVTGLATLIGLYASEYMAHDVGKGYARFFSAFALFVVSMSCLVMADNLILLYLGWEGVGLCSYLLIGYFYTKPEAVAAAKKAFIVNRIGDLGLALGIFLTFTTFGTVEYDLLFRAVGDGSAPIDHWGNPVSGWVTWAIPALFMLGAFGKSAQLPLYVWLPDAMEGPTPVSALIHAATMVTAGVYLIARMFPLFAGLDTEHHAITVVAWIGTLTALLAATIGMAQFDIKRIMAYSTVSQLGYMFAGLGFLTTTGAAFHVFTHAFFKAILFLACGAVMHGFAGQLDLRKLSGLWRVPGWRITVLAMLIGCINLAGVPFTAGFFSKDMILAEGFVTPGRSIMAWILLLTAGLTAYYTFRVFFRVFVGPVEFHPGDELHDDHHDTDHDSHDAHDHAGASDGASDGASGGGGGGGGFHPHAPQWAINTVLVLLSVGAVAAAGTYFVHKDSHGWVGHLLHDSSANYVSPYAHHDDHDHAAVDSPEGAMASSHGWSEAEPVVGDGAQSLAPEGRRNVRVIPVADTHTHDHHADASGGGGFLGMDPHKVMYYVSAIVGLIGILTAAFLHGPKGIGGLFLGNRTTAATSRADALLPYLGPIPKWAQNKWYVDELYDVILRIPLYVIANIFHAFDKLLVDGLVNTAGFLPRFIATQIRPSQSGILQGYAAAMAGGLAFILLVVFVLL